jgi:CDP-6-deoxy-D-xylo-4-hexulose-3-dehydrase
MEGGAITTNDREMYEMLLCLRSHGWTRNLPDDNVHKVKPGKFDFIYPGYNVRPTEMQAALGLVQLQKLPAFIEQRRENASRFPLKTQKEIGKSSWYGFAVFDSDVRKVDVSCETRPVVAGNFVRSPSIKYYDHEIVGTLKNADYIHDNACFIGNHATKIDWSFLG